MFSRMERQSVPLSTYLTQPSWSSLCSSRAPLSSVILPGRGQVPFHTGLPQSLFSPSQTGKGTPVFTTASQDFSKGMPDFEGRLANNNKQKQHLPCLHT